MPRKGAASAAPKTRDVDPENEPDTPENETAQQEEPAKPARRGRKTAEERAAERAANNGESADASDPDNPNAFEDWSKPTYASDPGEFEFSPLDDSDEFLSILWWGKEGTGKTTDLARVAASKLITQGEVKGRVLLINAEGGAKATPLRKQGIDTGQIVSYPPKGQAVTFEGLERLFYRLQADLETDPDSWAAVGWDSITAIFQKLLDDVIEQEMRRQAEILQKAKKTREGRSGNITLRDRFDTDGDDYAKMSNQMRLLLRKYRTLPCHLLITALERRDEDRKRKGNKAHYGPAVNPALATDLLGYMDIVIRTHVLGEEGANPVYYGRTTPTEDARGKDRMFALPVELVDPTFDRIYGYVKGDLDPDTDRSQKRMPNGAEGLPTRRSLADEDGSWHTQDGTPDGPPLEGDEDDPEPPKRSARRSRAASSGRTSASAKPSVTEEVVSSEPESDATELEPAAEESAKPARRGGRKTAAERTARQQVKEETEPTKSGPATRAAARRAKQREADIVAGFPDDPPF